MVKIDIAQLHFMLDHTSADHNIMLVGGHGIGKSEILTTYFHKSGLKVVSLFLGQMSDPGDIIGLPYRNEQTGRTEFMPPYWFPVDGNPIVLFLDELNRARPEVLQTIMDLTLSRKLAGRSLPDGSRVIAAVNHGEEYLLTEMDPALVSRFNVYEFKPSVREWLSWAKSSGVDSRVVRFIEAEPLWLDGETGSDRRSFNELKKTPDRRAWKRVSDLLFQFSEMESSVVKLVAGIVGEKAAKAFSAFLARPAEAELPFNASEILSDFSSFKPELKKAPVHMLTTLNSDIFRLLSGAVDASFAGGLLEYLKFLKADKKREVMADFVGLFSDKRNHKAVSFIGKECYEAVIILQEFVSGM